MLHAVLAAYTVCFAGGVTLIVVSLFASRRFSLRGFRDFALLFAAATLILVVDASEDLRACRGLGFRRRTARRRASCSPCSAMPAMTWYLLTLALQVARMPPSRTRILPCGILALAIAFLGGLNEAVPLLWRQAGPGMALWNANYLALLGIHVFAAVILLSGFQRIESPWLQAFVRSFLILLGVFAPLAAAQLVVQNIPTSPDFLRDYPSRAARSTTWHSWSWRSSTLHGTTCCLPGTQRSTCPKISSAGTEYRTVRVISSK